MPTRPGRGAAPGRPTDKVPGIESEPTAPPCRLEIVHESLLSQWPRLVHWRTQDAEGAQLRDQLRQAAQLWAQRGRGEDLLWVGTAYQEYQIWRARYPGGLTALEEEFAAAMTVAAWRRRRRRRLGLALLVTALATGLAVFATLRQQALGQARRAEAEARRAEASKLLALGQVELEGNPTAALAYVIRSLELDDSAAARRLVLRVLAAGPIARVLPLEAKVRTHGIVISPDGRWAVVRRSSALEVWGRDGSVRVLPQSLPSGARYVAAAFDVGARHLYGANYGMLRIWSVPGFELLDTQTIARGETSLRGTRAGMLAATLPGGEPRELLFDELAPGAPPRRVGRLRGSAEWDVDPGGRVLAYAAEQAVWIRALDGSDRPRRIGTYEGTPRIQFHPSGELVALHDDARGEFRLLPTATGRQGPLRTFRTPLRRHLGFDREGRRFAVGATVEEGSRLDLWDLEAPATSQPRSFTLPFGGPVVSVAGFTPDGRWLATAAFTAGAFWALDRQAPHRLLGHGDGVIDVEFASDGRLFSVDIGGEIREWGLGPGEASRVLARLPTWGRIEAAPGGRFLAVSQPSGALVIPLDGAAPRTLEGFDGARVLPLAIDAAGRRVAAASWAAAPDEKVIRIWDLDSGEVRVLGPTERAGEGGAGGFNGLEFLPDGSLLSAGDGGLRRWSLASGEHEIVAASDAESRMMRLGPGGLVVHVADPAPMAPGERGRERLELAITDLATRTTRVLSSHGDGILAVAGDLTGRIVASGDHDGIVRVGPASGVEPHLLIGHRGWVRDVAISPDGRWIASGGDDRAVHLWPMPDLRRPPLHTLPLDELLARLKRMTNMRVARGTSAGLTVSLRTGRESGYELDLEPFPGWAEEPER